MNSFLTTKKSRTNSPFLKFISPFYHWIRRNPTKPPPRHGYSFSPPLALSPSAWRQLQALEPFKGVNTSPPILHLRMENFGWKKSNKKSSYRMVSFFFNGDESHGIESVKKNKNTVVTVDNLVMFFLASEL